jgi:hypothetical protein
MTWEHLAMSLFVVVGAGVLVFVTTSAQDWFERRRRPHPGE